MKQAGTISENFEYEIIEKAEDLGRVVQEFGRPDIVGWDFETTGLDFMRDEIAGLGISHKDKGYYIARGALEPALPWLIDMVESDEVITLAHNGKFDLHFLLRVHEGLKEKNNYDTMTAQWLVDENQAKGLKDLAYRYYGIRNLKSFKDILKEAKKVLDVGRMDEVDVHEIPLDIIGPYGAFDAWLLPHLWNTLVPLVKKEEQWDYYINTATPFARVLVDMEKNGLYIMQDKLQEVKKEFEGRYEELLDEWNRKTGDVNPRSPQQLVELLYGELKLTSGRTTKTDNPSTDAISLMRMRRQDSTGTVALLQEIKTLDKMLSTYVYKFEEEMYHGRIHGSYNQTGTVSGRLSSSDPNLQNIPAHGEDQSQLRKVIGAPPGFDMLVVDYSQVELRIVAHYSQDPILKEVFQNDGDPHQTTADLISVDRNKVAKHLNFAWLYMTTARTFCDTIEKKGYERPEESEAQAWMDMFEDKYVGLVDYQQEVLKWARKLKWTRTLAGRRRHVPEINHYNSYYRGRAERQAFNSIIQGSAGDVINWAMLQLPPIVEFYGAKMQCQVHDELVFIVPQEVTKSFAAVVQETMEAAEEEFNISVPIKAEPNHGKNWYEAK